MCIDVTSMTYSLGRASRGQKADEMMEIKCYSCERFQRNMFIHLSVS